MITTKLCLHGMREGDVCGMVSLGGAYTDFAVRMENGRKLLVQRTGEWTKDNETESVCGELTEDIVYLRMYVEKETHVSFAYSRDGVSFTAAGQQTDATPGRWVGVKAGLFAINEKDVMGGFMETEYFVFERVQRLK